MTGARTPEMDAFVADAKAVGIVEAFGRVGGRIGRGKGEVRATGAGSQKYVGSCPACGGIDRFSMDGSPGKNVYNCRGCGGGDALGLAQKVLRLDFLEACEVLAGRERPGLARTDEERRAYAARCREAEARAAARQREADAATARAVRTEAEFREREWDRCLAIWRDAGGEPPEGGAMAYLEARGLGAAVPQVDPQYVRTHAHLGFFVKPERGPAIAIHYGPAMVALFVRPDGDRWERIGIHQTWLDLGRDPKFRPELHHPETGEIVPTKKMRGTKMGGLIPLIGRYSQAHRMVAGEGIETVLGFARFDGFRADTFYCAAGDIGNLCGKATSASRFRHPTLRITARNGRSQPVWVQGTEPEENCACLPVPDHVTELVLLGDGDSEPVMTRAAMKRGVKRHAREGREVRSLFAPAGGDWADVGAALEPELEDA